MAKTPAASRASTYYDKCATACVLHALLASLATLVFIAMLPSILKGSAEDSHSITLTWCTFIFAWLAWPFIIPFIPREKTHRPGKLLLVGFILWLPSVGLPWLMAVTSVSHQ